MACHHDKMTPVELAEAALAAHKEKHVAMEAGFCARKFGCVLTDKWGNPVYDGEEVKKYSFTWGFATNVVLTGAKKFPQKVVNEVRKQIEANNEEYAIWRAESDAKLAELEDALATAKAEEKIFVPEEVPARGEDGDDDGRPMPRTTTRYPALEAAEAEDEERICAELDRQQHAVAAFWAAFHADMDVRAGDSEEADDAFNPPGLYDRDAWVNEGKKMPEAESWADAADDDEATKEAENLAKLKRMFALTTQGKSYASVARA